MALVKELVYRILTEGFQMSLIVNLDTKSNQLAALKEVRESSSTKYKLLKEEEDKLNKNYHALLKSTNRGSVSFTKWGLADENDTSSQLAPPPPQD